MRAPSAPERTGRSDAEVEAGARLSGRLRTVVHVLAGCGLGAAAGAAGAWLDAGSGAQLRYVPALIAVLIAALAWGELAALGAIAAGAVVIRWLHGAWWSAGAGDGVALVTYAIAALMVTGCAGAKRRLWARGAARLLRGMRDERERSAALAASERRFRTLVESSAAIIWTAGPDRMINREAPTWEAFTGQPAREYLGAGWLAAVHPDDREPTMRAWEDAARRSAPVEVECRVRRADGVYRLMRARGVPVLNERGETVEWLGSMVDVEEERRTQERLRESEARFRASVARAAAGFEQLAATGAFIDLNEAACRLLGYSREELLGLSYEQITHPEDAGGERLLVAGLVAGRIDHYSMDKRYLRRDGTPLWVSLTSSCVRDESGRPLYRVSIWLDASGRRRAEGALRDREARLRLALDAASLGTWDQDLTTGVLTWDERTRAMFGVPLDAPHGRSTLLDRIEPEDREQAAAVARRALDPAGDGAFQVDFRVRMSPPVWVRAIGRAIFEGGRAVRLAGTVRDITPQKQAEQTAARLAAVAESSGEALVGLSREGVITAWNPAACRLFGYEAGEVLGRGVRVIVPDDRWGESEEIRSQAMSGRRIEQVETRRIRKDGTVVDVSVTLAPVVGPDGEVTGIAEAIRDVTDRKRTEGELARYRAHLEDLVAHRTIELEERGRQLRVAERLAAVGTLAAGLGHDLANLLLPIRARIESLRRLLLSPGARADLESIEAAMNHLQEMSAGMRLLSLDPSVESASTQVEDLHRWWLEARGVLHACVPQHVRLEAAILPGTPGVRMARHRFTQVVFNLVQNAGEAMARQADGVVRIAAEYRGESSEIGARSSEAEAGAGTAKRGKEACGGAILITISDNGPGMPPEVLRRCFDPYFSTKRRVISTGMGLSLVRGLVDKAGGTIAAASEVGQGTTFRITLPETDSPPEGEGRLEGPVAIVSIAEERRAAMVSMMLRGLGARVVQGVAGPELEVRNEHPRAEGAGLATRDRQLTRVDLWVGGPDRAGEVDELRRMNPALRVAVMSEPGSVARYDEPVARGERTGSLPGNRVLTYLGSRPTAGSLRDALARMISEVAARPGGPENVDTVPRREQE